MMRLQIKHLAIGIGTLALLAGAPSVSSANFIGFEDFGNVGVSGPIVTNQYLGQGAVFSSAGNEVNMISSQAGIGDGLNFLCTGNGSVIDCTGETIVDFTSGVSGLSFLQCGDNATGVVAHVDVFTGGAFNSTVDILGFDTFHTPDLVDLTGYSNVTKIRIYGITDGGGLGWDDFTFNPSTSGVTPEPGSMGLLGLGLAAAAIAYRRKS